MDIFDFIESIQYEARPFAYAFAAGFAFVNREVSPAMLIAASILTLCSYIVFRMRYENRFKLGKARRDFPRRLR